MYQWIEEQWEHTAFWWIKRLSARDTLAMAGSNPGPRVPHDLILKFLPELSNPHESKLRAQFLLNIDNSGDKVLVTVGFIDVGLKRGEPRRVDLVTDWGGASNPLLDSENTGSAAVFAFHLRSEDTVPECHVWVCANLAEEEDVVESIWGPILPGVEILSSMAEGTREKLYSN